MRTDTEHHTSLEATLREISEMMARQEVVSQLVARESSTKQELVQALVARQHAVELETRLNRLHPADAAFVLESLPGEQRDVAWQLIRKEGRGTILLELAASVREPLVALLEDDELLALGKQLPSTDFADLVENLPKIAPSPHHRAPRQHRAAAGADGVVLPARQRRRLDGNRCRHGAR